MFALACGSPTPPAHVTTPEPDASASAKPDAGEAEVDPSVAGLSPDAIERAPARRRDPRCVRSPRRSGATRSMRQEHRPRSRARLPAYPTAIGRVAGRVLRRRAAAIGFVSTSRRTNRRPCSASIRRKHPTARVAAMFRARQAVIEAVEGFEPDHPAAQPRRLRAAISGESGILVSLLAGTTRNDTVVLGTLARAYSRGPEQGARVEPMSRARSSSRRIHPISHQGRSRRGSTRRTS